MFRTRGSSRAYLYEHPLDRQLPRHKPKVPAMEHFPRTSQKLPGLTTSIHHGIHIPNSTTYTPLEQTHSSPTIHDLLTKLQCCPTPGGAAAAIIVSQSFLDGCPHLKDPAIIIAGQGMATDTASQFSGSAMDPVGYQTSKFAADTAFKEAGIKPRDCKVCFSK